MTESSTTDRPDESQDRLADPGPDQEPQSAAAPGPGVTDETVEPTSVEDAPEAAAESPEVTDLKASLADRTSDLQRIQAEYVNYKRRVDRDRDTARAGGVESVLRELLSVLDNVSSARQHEELSPGFKAVADELERVTTKHGLTAYGVAGDAFDPHVHEALMHVPAPEGSELTGPTCVQILQSGYKIGERVVRPARVAVADPA